jgi:hypothetical protein
MIIVTLQFLKFIVDYLVVGVFDLQILRVFINLFELKRS